MVILCSFLLMQFKEEVAKTTKKSIVNMEAESFGIRVVDTGINFYIKV